jgi:hypothetical protein
MTARKETLDIGDPTVTGEHLTVSAADHPTQQSRAWRLRDPLALGSRWPWSGFRRTSARSMS